MPSEPIDYGQRVDGQSGVGPIAAQTPAENNDGRVHPRNPFIGLWFAIMILLSACAAIVNFVLFFDQAVAGELYGQRVEGMILATPWLLLAAGSVSLVRALLAVGTWFAYRARTSAEQRRRDRAWDLRTQSLLPLYLFGVPAFGGTVLFGVATVVGLIGLAAGGQSTGFPFILEFFFGLTALSTACIGQLAQVYYYRRYFVEFGASPAS